jgi:pyruvate formate lyase activating enzyme
VRGALEKVEERTGPLAIGRPISVHEAMRELERDTNFYDESGGGITFSGGEPLAQHQFLVDLLGRCGELDIHRAVDTCGHAPREVLLNVAKQTDLFLYDLKSADDATHAQYTGVDTALIRENLRALCETDVAIEIRIPVIAGINATVASLKKLGSSVQALPRPLPLRLLPYHRMAMDKYRRFGLAPPLPDRPEPTASEMERLRACLRDLGLEVRE